MQAHQPCNIGLVVPDGHVVVEADSEDADQELLSLQAEVITITRAPRPGRGRALLFVLAPDLAVKNATHLGASKGIDVIAPGGILVVPPSVHASGHVYAWVEGCSPQDLRPADIPPKLAQLLPKKLPAIPPSKPTNVMNSAPPFSFLLRADRELQDLWHGRGKRDGDTTETGYDWSIACRLAKQGHDPKYIAEVLAQRPRTKPREPTYFERTANNASGKGTK